MSKSMLAACIGWFLFTAVLIYSVMSQNYDRSISSATKGLNCELSGGVALRADVDGRLSVIACLNKEAIK